MATFKIYELLTSYTRDSLVTCSACLGEKLFHTGLTVWQVLASFEAVTNQGHLAVGALKALPVPGLVTIGDPFFGDHLFTPTTLLCMSTLKAVIAVDIAIRDSEGLDTNITLAGAADETSLMPLSALVPPCFHFCTKHLSTCCTSRPIARTTVNMVSLGPKLLVYQAGLAFVAEKAGLMPVLFLVGKVLVVNTDNLSALGTTVGKDTLVTFDTVGIVFIQDISVSSQAVITMMTKQTFKLQLLTRQAIVHFLGIGICLQCHLFHPPGD